MERSPYASSSPFAGVFIAPRKGGYPYDFDASLRYMRPISGYAIAPHPPLCGYVQGLLPMMNASAAELAWAKMPYGPWSGELPTDAEIAFPNAQLFWPELRKQGV